MGLAVADDTTGIVTPLAVVPFRDAPSAVQVIATRLGETGAAQVVLGLPTLADGRRGPACRRSEDLADALDDLGISVVFQAEFLTTDEARRRAREVGRPARQPVDDIAAQVLLEEYLATQRADEEA
jgi:putative transcription antitermination factor YqgF